MLHKNYCTVYNSVLFSRVGGFWSFNSAVDYCILFYIVRETRILMKNKAKVEKRETRHFSLYFCQSTLFKRNHQFSEFSLIFLQIFCRQQIPSWRA